MSDYFDPGRPVERREVLVQSDGSCWIMCPACKGSGLQECYGGGAEDCSTCGGGHHVEIDQSTPLVGRGWTPNPSPAPGTNPHHPNTHPHHTNA